MAKALSKLTAARDHTSAKAAVVEMTPYTKHPIIVIMILIRLHALYSIVSFQYNMFLIKILYLDLACALTTYSEDGSFNETLHHG